MTGSFGKNREDPTPATSSQKPKAENKQPAARSLTPVLFCLQPQT
jgi:hypothetical protein